MENNFTAEKARQNVLNYSNSNDVLEEIISQIESASKDGSTFVSFDFYLTKELMTNLQKLGFIVQRTENPDLFLVTWKM